MDILTIIDLAAAFAVSVLCGMGVGGGGLFVIYLTLCRSVPQLEAQGINLAFFIASAAAALILHAKKRGIPFKKAAPIGLFGALGSIGGSALAHALDTSAVRTAFGIMLIGSGLLVLLGKKGSNKKSSSP